MSILDVEMLSPRDPERIRKRTFARVRKGYDADQVQEYLGRVAESVQEMLQEMEGLRERAEAALANAPPEGTFVQGEAGEAKDPYEALGEHVAEVLRSAEQHAERIRVEAYELSEKAISDAQQEAAKALQVAQEDADALRERAEEDAERTRASASDELETAREEAARIRAAAGEVLDAARGEAERMLTGLAQRRHHLVSELQSTRERLVTIVDQLQNAVEEDSPAIAEHLSGTEEHLVIPESGPPAGAEGPGGSNGNSGVPLGSWPEPPQPPPPPEDLRDIWPVDPFAPPHEPSWADEPAVAAPPPPDPPKATSSPTEAPSSEGFDRPVRPDLDEDKLDELLEGASPINLTLPEIPPFEDEPDDDDRP